MSSNQAKERVLSTMNVDGTRRWLRPTLAPGDFWKRRALVGWGLIALFVALPLVHVGGKPAMLLDVLHREFTFFGTTLYATDTVLLMLAMLGIFLSVFLLTALFGRAWCGWGCPQTVYMEYVFRPLERLIEGDLKSQIAMDKQRFHPRRLLKYAVYAVLAVVLANVFLAYFVGVGTLQHWVLGSPTDHPQGFAIVAVTSVLMFIDFAWFREQMCVVACPYARIQSALLDKQSLIVAYDRGRGEPRGKLRKVRADDTGLARSANSAAASPAEELIAAAGDSADLQQSGDCIDCGACVRTCPTGIDIRDGLQMECISCTQCIDACDAIMDRIKKPRGLVRYSSQDEIEQRASASTKHKFLRVRTIMYPLGLTVIGALFLFAMSRRTDSEVTLLRGIAAPFDVQGTAVMNQMRVKIHNHSKVEHSYKVELMGQPPLELVGPENPMRVKAGEVRTVGFFVTGKVDAIRGALDVPVRVGDGQGFEKTVTFKVLGPRP
jgi:polyferredoxin